MKNKKLAIIALFSALGAILMLFDFPIPIAPSFMKIDLSDIPVIVGGFLFGPVESLIIAVLKILIKMVIKPTSTAGVGELANLIGTIAYVLPASILYNKLKNKRRATVGLVIGTIASSLVITICNKLFIFPFYIKFIPNITEERIVSMCNKILPIIDNMDKVYAISVLPFNLIKYTIVSIITFLFYKRISIIIKNI